jgi:hypothetical protein
LRKNAATPGPVLQHTFSTTLVEVAGSSWWHALEAACGAHHVLHRSPTVCPPDSVSTMKNAAARNTGSSLWESKKRAYRPRIGLLRWQ